MGIGCEGFGGLVISFVEAVVEIELHVAKLACWSLG